jgi:small GTP-binding protein
MRGGLEAKLVVLGSQGVGKTSLAYRYASGQFNPSAVPSTIGAAFLTKKLVVDNVNCRLQLWDTSGQEKWRAIAPMYYRGSHAALLVYDITSRRSFDDLKYWIDELKKNMGDDLIIHVVGAKSDLADSRQIEPHQAREQVLQWLHPERAAAIAASQASQTSAQSSVPMSKSTSRLSSLGNLAMESASRFATAFPSTGRSGGSVMKASDSSNGSGSGACSDSAGDATILLLPGDDNMNIEVSEVSSKDDRGIEEGEFGAVGHGDIIAPFD